MTTEAPAVTTNAPAAAPALAAKPDATAASPEAPKPETPEKSFSQKELDDIVERRLAKERRKRQEIENRLKVTEELVTRSKPQTDPQPRGNGEAKEPKRDDFESYEAYVEARAEWRADRKVDERLKKRDEEQQHRTAAEKQQERAAAFRKRTEELAKEMPDFRDVLAEATADPESAVSRLHAEPVDECENPAAVLYHLAKNPDEAERIASLPAAKQAREIWALDARLKSGAPAKQPSKAPAPINPVGGKTVKGDEMPEPLLPGGQVNPAWSDWRRRQGQPRK